NDQRPAHRAYGRRRVAGRPGGAVRRRARRSLPRQLDARPGLDEGGPEGLEGLLPQGRLKFVPVVVAPGAPAPGTAAADAHLRICSARYWARPTLAMRPSCV